MNRRRNGDDNIRALERAYSNDPTFENGLPLLAAYLRADHPRLRSFFLEVAPMYNHLEGHIPGEDLPTENLLLTVWSKLGLASTYFSGRKVWASISKPLLWDYMRGYPPGTTQNLLDKIIKAAVSLKLVEGTPRIVDIVPGDFNEAEFETATKPFITVHIFHPYSTTDGFLRILSRPIHIEGVKPRLHKLTLMIEDEPIRYDYEGPVVSMIHVPDCGATSKSEFSTTSTARVKLDLNGKNAKSALKTVTKLTRKIWFAKDFAEAGKYSGPGTWDEGNKI